MEKKEQILNSKYKIKMHWASVNKSNVLDAMQEYADYCVEKSKREISQEINNYWTFDNSQQHTHSWHDKQKFLEEFKKVK